MTSTSWSGVTRQVTSWLVDYITGRHTYGAEYGTTTRIVFGDHVRYGGMANISDPRTPWSGVSAVRTNWT